MSKRLFYRIVFSVVLAAGITASIVQYRIVSDGAYMERLKLTGDDTAQWISFGFALLVTAISLVLLLTSLKHRKKQS